MRHSIMAGGTVVNPIPLLPIELNDAQTWKLPQNPGFYFLATPSSGEVQARSAALSIV